MSARVLYCVALIGLGATPTLADTIIVPGVTTVDRSHPRPRTRDRVFPPPQYDLIGRRVPLARAARPTYRDANNDYPPPGGRFGGGFLEYVLTGGRPEPIAPTAPVSASPVARFFSPGPYAAPNPGRSAPTHCRACPAFLVCPAPDHSSAKPRSTRHLSVRHLSSEHPSGPCRSAAFHRCCPE